MNKQKACEIPDTPKLLRKYSTKKTPNKIDFKDTGFTLRAFGRKQSFDAIPNDVNEVQMQAFGLKKSVAIGTTRLKLKCKRLAKKRTCIEQYVDNITIVIEKKTYGEHLTH